MSPEATHMNIPKQIIATLGTLLLVEMATVFTGNKFNQLDDEVDAGGVEREAVFDLASLDKQEASKHLFGQVPWDDYLRAGVFLNQNDVRMIYSCSMYICNC